MASTRFLERSVRVMQMRTRTVRRADRRGLRRLGGVTASLALAAGAFFALKGAAIATGAPLPGGEGLGLWLAGADPVASALAAALEPVFAGRS